MLTTTFRRSAARKALAGFASVGDSVRDPRAPAVADCAGGPSTEAEAVRGCPATVASFPQGRKNRREVRRWEGGGENVFRG